MTNHGIYAYIISLDLLILQNYKFLLFGPLLSVSSPSQPLVMAILDSISVSDFFSYKWDHAVFFDLAFFT
jgi:hypothetical protein